MLRREADGVRWWIERQALLGVMVPPPGLVMAWVTRGDSAAAARQAEALADAVQRELPVSGTRASRITLNGYWQDEDDGRSHDSGRWTAERYRQVLDRVARPDGSGLDLLWEVADRRRPQSYYWAPAITLHCSAGFTLPGIWEWTLKASDGLFRGEALDPAGEAWARLLHIAGSWPRTLWGAVFHDHWDQNLPLPYERYFGLEIPSADTAHTARGYYWANLLTAEHLVKLGGPAAAGERCAALGLRFEPVSGTGGDVAVVRAAEPVSVLGDTSLEALRDFLAPVLKVVPYRVFYNGPPLRVLKDPGTAFRWVPPVIKHPWFDDDPPLTPDMPAYTLVPDAGKWPNSR
jgi:hypothetical protein